MADTQVKAWTISAGAVGRKPVRRSYGGAHSVMSISTTRRHTTVNWHSGASAGTGKQVWQGVVSALVEVG